MNSELLHLPVEVAFSLFNKDAYFTHPCMPLHPVCDRRTDHNFTMAMDILSSDPLTSLLKVLQDGCPIEDYVEEFLNISNRVPWKKRTLKTIVARGAWFSEVCSGRKTQETAVSKWVKCKMRITCV